MTRSWFGCQSDFACSRWPQGCFVIRGDSFLEPCSSGQVAAGDLKAIGDSSIMSCCINEVLLFITHLSQLYLGKGRQMLNREKVQPILEGCLCLAICELHDNHVMICLSFSLCNISYSKTTCFVICFYRGALDRTKWVLNMWRVIVDITCLHSINYWRCWTTKQAIVDTLSFIYSALFSLGQRKWFVLAKGFVKKFWSKHLHLQLFTETCSRSKSWGCRSKRTAAKMDGSRWVWLVLGMDNLKLNLQREWAGESCGITFLASKCTFRLRTSSILHGNRANRELKR